MAEASRPPVTKLWDLPTRIVHWALVVLILVAWFTGGENMQLHRWVGYGILGLIVFRLWWGVAGGSTARFSSFIRGPRETLAYVRTIGRRDSPDLPGHNPLGAWSIVAMLLLMVVQVTLGLFASDIDGIESGPLSHLVDFDTSRAMAEWHELIFRGLQAVIALHIVAVVFYLVYKRRNLISAMFTGSRRFASEGPSVTFAPLWRLAVGIVLAVGVAWFVAKGLKF